MLKRERNRKIKSIVRSIIGNCRLSVRSGRGTASNWIYVITKQKITSEQREQIEKVVIEQKLIGTYLQDIGPASGWEPCISYRTI